jgi:hypothetical protein
MLTKLSLVSVAMTLALALAACGGEVTTLDFGAEQEDSFDRYREEIQPILALEDEDNPNRNCASNGFCHTPPNGFGGFNFYPDPNEEQLNDNHQAVLALMDPQDPPASRILFVPLPEPEGGRLGHAASFPSKEDCCYQKILAWGSDEPSPECTCP